MIQTQNRQYRIVYDVKKVLSETDLGLVRNGLFEDVVELNVLLPDVHQRREDPALPGLADNVLVEVLHRLSEHVVDDIQIADILSLTGEQLIKRIIKLLI